MLLYKQIPIKLKSSKKKQAHGTILVLEKNKRHLKIMQDFWLKEKQFQSLKHLIVYKKTSPASKLISNVDQDQRILKYAPRAKIKTNLMLNNITRYFPAITCCEIKG